MKYLSEIPHLKVSQSNIYVDTDKKTQSMYSLIFLLSNSDDSSDLINNTQLNKNNKFHHYFMDSVYDEKIFKKHKRFIATKDREKIYKNIKSNCKGLITERSMRSIAKKNTYVDLYFYNKLFFETIVDSNAYMIRVKEYINYLADILKSDEYSAYRYKTMIVDTGKWISRDNKNVLTITSKLDNPIFYFYWALVKFPDELKELGNINIAFQSNNMIMRLNPSQVEKNSYQLFKREITKLEKDTDYLINKSDDEVEEIYAMYKLVHQHFKPFNLTGGDKDIQTKINKKVDELVDESDGDLSDKEIHSKVEDELKAKSKELLMIANQSKTGKSAQSLKRDKELREKQFELQFDNMSIQEILAKSNESKESALPINDISSKVTSTNKNIFNVSYPNFEKSYNERLLESDIINSIVSLNEKSIPVFVRSVDVEDTSDELNLKKTYTVKLEDGNRGRHTLKFDLPKFIDGKFMYLNGNKKLIVKQLYLKPIVKTGPDEVQICSSYNKMFIERYGARLSSDIEKLKKALMTNATTYHVKTGNCSSENKDFRVSLEYSDIGRNILSFKIGKQYEFYFNQVVINDMIKKHNVKINTESKNYMVIGFENKSNTKKPIIMDLDSQVMENGEPLVDYIINLDDKLKESFKGASSGKKFIYTRAVIMRKRIPLILLLGYVEGLTTVLRKAKIAHQFSDTRVRVDETKQGIIKFSDGYLIYDKYPLENSLLMNAFADIPTKGYNYSDFDDKLTYLSIFDVMFKQRNIGNAFDNFYEWMIDPIMKEVLEDLNYPTDFVSLVLFANSLLTDSSYTSENDLSLYRIRSNEVIPAYLYKEISDAYSRFKATSKNKNPLPISIPQDAVLKRVLTAQTIEDYSQLNPIVELEKSRAITKKGHTGMNQDRAYTQDKRVFSKSMLGLVSMSTSPDANCGIIRELTLEPKILNARGYIEDNTGDVDKLTDVNLFSPAELLSPLGATRDDTIRTAMATKQSKHIIPIKKSSPVLISNGAEQAIQYHLSDDFNVVAEFDGVVQEINEDAGLMIVKYTTGDYKAIEINSKVVKNGAGGFYLPNKLKPKFKEGQKFKKNDILAYDENFFSEDLHGNRFNIGSLQKVACMSAYSTYEDSTFITKKISEEMASDIVMVKPIVLGKNSNLDYIVKVGQEVQVGDELIRFETSYDDESLNKFLVSVGDELKEEILSLGKVPIKSKYSGIIEDIKIYSTVDLEELSPSLRKEVSKYYTKINKKKKLMDKYEKSDGIYRMGILLNEATSKIETKDGKVKGYEVGDGVLIEIFIKYSDTMGVGDKLTYFTALKSIVGQVIEEGQEPYSLFRPDEEVSSFIAPSAVLARMTPSILLTMFGNKVLVELKRSLEKIYNE